MSTTRSKDRAGLCSFTFANGHRCRTSRSASHPHLCYDHARKESHARAIDQIGRDINPPLLRNNKPCRMIDMRMSIKTRRFI